MIHYESKNWHHLLFAVKGTVAPRTLRRVALYGGLTLVLLFAHYSVANLPPFDPLGHSLLGVALGMLVVFRTNTSYDRYWEGRKLWGSLLAATRNLVRGAVAYGGDVTGLVNLVVAYNRALKQHLRSDRDLSEIEPLVSPECYRLACAADHPPAMVAFHISTWIRDHMNTGELDSATGRALEGCINNMTENAGGCERIVQTPIPFAYAAHIKQMLVLYMMTLPFVLVPKMGIAAVLAVAGIAFGLVGLEEAGVEIEDPFGTDLNDLPLEEFCATLAGNAKALIDVQQPLRRAA